jgi:hypothetical protein
MRILMTALTTNDGMHPQQRKSAEVVIKENICLPALLAMAVFTLLPHGALMGVVPAMAGNTALIVYRAFDTILMALLTLDLLVSALEREVGQVMVEESAFPAPFLVATGAILAILSKVNVVRLVAALTI